jgi:very-long-chain ceramide synthase
MAGWMKWQIFVPILLLQCLNLFWYFLIWRIFWRYALSFISCVSPRILISRGWGDRAVTADGIKDERSDDEDSDESPVQKKKQS